MVDMEPKQGRFLLRKASSLARYKWFEAGGKISRVSGKRVYFNDDTGVELFTHEYSAICDTKAEYDKLLAFTAKAKAEFAKVADRLDAELLELLAPLQKGKAKAVRAGKPAPAPEATPSMHRKRTRKPS